MSIYLYTFLTIQLLFVTYFDIKTKKISNWWSILNIITFFALVFFSDQHSFTLKTMLISFVFIIVGFVLFTLNIMGGGDSKYLCTTFLIVPNQLQGELLNLLLYSTVLTGSILLIMSITANFKQILQKLLIYDLGGIKSYFGGKFAFAPVILMSWVIFGIKLELWKQW